MYSQSHTNVSFGKGMTLNNYIMLYDKGLACVKLFLCKHIVNGTKGQEGLNC